MTSTGYTEHTTDNVSSVVTNASAYVSQPDNLPDYTMSDGTDDYFYDYEYDYDPELQSWLLKMSHVQNRMYIYGAPLIIIFGITGNMLSLMVLRSRYFAKAACGVLLSILAVTDSVVLLTGLLRVWIMETFDYDIRIRNVASCRSHYFVTYLMQHMSSWTVVLVTVERFISVYYPLKAKRIFNRKRLRIAIASLVTTLAAVNSHVLFSLEVYTENYSDPFSNITFQMCLFPEENVFGNVIWPWVDFVILALLPFIILVTGNGMIVAKVAKKLREQEILTHSQQQQQQQPQRQDQAREGLDKDQQQQQQQQQQRQQQQQNQQQQQQATRRRKTSSLTFMLFGITCLFLITMTPYEIYLIGMGHGAWHMETPRSNSLTALANVICELVFYMNNAASFLLYCVSGSRFRMALKEYFKKPFKRMRPKSSYLIRSDRLKTSSSVMSKSSVTG